MFNLLNNNYPVMAQSRGRGVEGGGVKGKGGGGREGGRVGRWREGGRVEGGREGWMDIFVNIWLWCHQHV